MDQDLFPLYKPQPPFMDFQGGVGFQGVILQSLSTGKIQCHLCGGMFKSVARHIQHRHDITCDEYREVVGLNKTTPLVSEATSEKLREAYMTSPDKEQKILLLQENSKRVHKNWKQMGRLGQKASVQQKNLFGTCDLQAREMFYREYKQLGRVPLQNEISQSLKSIVYTRFGSYYKALGEWGIDEPTIQEVKNIPKRNAYEARRAMSFFPKYDKETVSKAYKNFLIEHGRLPSWAEAQRRGMGHREVCNRLFGVKTKKELLKIIEKV